MFETEKQGLVSKLLGLVPKLTRPWNNRGMHTSSDSHCFQVFDLLAALTHPTDTCRPETRIIQALVAAKCPNWFYRSGRLIICDGECDANPAYSSLDAAKDQVVSDIEYRQAENII